MNLPRACGGERVEAAEIKGFLGSMVAGMWTNLQTRVGGNGRYNKTLSHIIKVSAFAGLGLFCSGFAAAEPRHGAALYGEPALPESYDCLPYADPDAPQTGRIIYGEKGRFDSFNPWIIRGRSPWAVRTHLFETLMARSWDEPFTLYGLLAESIDIADDRRSVTFAIRPEAKFADGSPVTPEDIAFSMETLRDHGRFANHYKKVAAVEALDERRVRFVFKEPERELPLLMGLMPIHSKADWEGRDFEAPELREPLTTGPYRIADHAPGDFLTLEKRDDYWGKGLPITCGTHNFETVTYRYYRDGGALFEAFKAGEIDQYREFDPANWDEGYDFPALNKGDVERGVLPHGRVTGMYGFTFNTRKPIFDDWRVREALTLAFDFEWVNAALNRGYYERIESYFSNSSLGFDGAATGLERDLLLPFEDALPEGALDTGYALPTSSGNGRNRLNIRRAKTLLKDAGWQVKNGVLTNADGQPFTFEILLRSSESKEEKVAASFRRNLELLGVDVQLRLVEGAQYQNRLNEYDFDMIVRKWWLSLSPGAELRLYFGADGVEAPGTRNYMGAKNPAIDAMIDEMLNATTRENYVAAIRALDRVLVSGRYVIPLWYEPVDRFAWWARISKPDTTPIYGYRPEVWFSSSN